MSRADDVLLTDRVGRVTVVTLNRPGKSNSLNQALITALDDLVDEVERGLSLDDPVRAIVLTGAGDKAFSAGADVSELDGISPESARQQMRRGQQVFDRIEQLPVVVVAAINGFALGGGLELAMAADIRVAARSARLGQPEITLGNIPGWGGTQRLPRLVGRGRALELILTGELVDAGRGEAIGLVNRVDDDAVESAVALAEAIASRSPVAVAGAKRAVHAGLEQGLAAGEVIEADAVAACCATDEQRAAVRAFLDRRRTTGTASTPPGVGSAGG